MKSVTFVACAVLLSGPQCTQSSGPRARIELHPYRKIRSVDAVIAGSSAKMLFDTGGGLTMISPALAAKVGCEPWGRMTGYRMTGERLDGPQCNDVTITLGQFKVRAPVVGVVDLMRYLPKDAAPVDGLIALDLFDRQAITVDLVRNVVIVESPTSLESRTRTMREGSARLERQLQGAALDVHVSARTPRGPIWFQLDTGNGGSLLVAKHVASLVDLDPAGKTPQPGHLNLDGDIQVDGNFFVPDLILDGNLGMPFLSKWIITIDLARTRIWFAPAMT